MNNDVSTKLQKNHGISESDTEDAPVFSKVWQQLEERIVEIFFSDQNLDDVRYQIATIPFVAHNARFDEGCLKAVFRVYQMDYPDYRFYDTLTASRRQFGRSLPNHQLHTVAAACGYNLETIITLWPMLKPVQLSPYTYYKYVAAHHISVQFIPNIL